MAVRPEVETIAVFQPGDLGACAGALSQLDFSGRLVHLLEQASSLENEIYNN